MDVKKMGPFEGFHRRCIVVVPSDEEYERRKQKKQSEGGRKITNENMMKWKAAMSLPEKDDNLFEKIEYLDLPEEDAKKLVAKYNEEGDAFKKLQDEKYGRSTDDRDRRSDSRTSRSREVTLIHRLFYTRTLCPVEIRTLNSGRIIIKSILSATGNIQAQHHRL